MSTRGETPTATRRRGAVLLADIHDAIRAEVMENGYTAITFDGIARRARVSKPVLYRRYPTRAYMVADAFVATLQGAAMTTTTGSLRRDLHNVFENFLQPSRAVGPAALRALLGEADEQLLAHVAGLGHAPALASLRFALAAARDRGELGPAPIPEVVNESIAAIFQSHALRHRIDANDIDSIIDEIALPLYHRHSQTPPPKRV